MERKFIIQPPDVVAMSAQAADKLIRDGSAEAALLYIYLLRHGGDCPLEQAERELRLRSAAGALRTLESLGLVGTEARRGPIRPEDAPPQYTVEEIRGSIARGSNFGELVQEVQGLLGRVLSGGDLVTLYGIYDYLGMPVEVILLLVRHCMELCRQKYGEGRRPTLRAIEKEAYRWAEAEVMSLPRAEAYLARRAQESDAAVAIRRVLGLSDRALSKSEGNYIAAWARMGFGAEAVALAYDRTTMSTGKLSWAYMDSILRSWHAKGLHTPAEIQQGDPQRARGKSPSPPADEGEDLSRMQAYLEQLKRD